MKLASARSWSYKHRDVKQQTNIGTMFVWPSKSLKTGSLGCILPDRIQPELQARRIQVSEEVQKKKMEICARAHAFADLRVAMQTGQAK